MCVAGEMISQGHMCLWCNERSKLFRGVRDVQKHMVDKGHCKIKHDESTRHQFADFYDYRYSHFILYLCRYISFS